MDAPLANRVGTRRKQPNETGRVSVQPPTSGPFAACAGRASPERRPDLIHA